MSLPGVITLSFLVNSIGVCVGVILLTVFGGNWESVHAIKHHNYNDSLA